MPKMNWRSFWPAERIRILMSLPTMTNQFISFRGAAVSNVLQFKKNFPEAKIITLTKNYRSTQTILDAAYKLIQHNNPNRLEIVEHINKKLLSKFKSKGKPIELIHEQRADDEVRCDC